ncbi:hypothetical protein PoB_002159500 [Plakobranchus ocellatus]|uniref:Uncharacterized protein n=1 Tax=Plakobranchus ocellatus TaxID=259542 RepID=A0AAV3ZHI6_9GAST|nr:hypothetical protein PoB_002159500 [Plakobranchus ocellatus]
MFSVGKVEVAGYDSRQNRLSRLATADDRRADLAGWLAGAEGSRDTCRTRMARANQRAPSLRPASIEEGKKGGQIYASYVVATPLKGVCSVSSELTLSSYSQPRLWACFPLSSSGTRAKGKPCPGDLGFNYRSFYGWGVGGTLVSKSALISTGILLSRVRAPPPAPWPDGWPKSLR